MTKSKIYHIDDLDLTILKTNPSKISITVYGVAPTGGWTSPELSPYIYIAPPADGIQDFDFVAEPSVLASGYSCSCFF